MAGLLIRPLACITLIALALTGCFHPPFNNFQRKAAFAGLYRSSEDAVIKDLNKYNVQFIHYGDTRVIIIPTDQYFVFNSAHLNDICYPALNKIVQLLRFYPCSTFYVAGFTDDVGSRHNKRRLSQAQAEAMLTFLWANKFSARQLRAEGFADQYAIGDNQWIRGSAYNRRIEIEWMSMPKSAPEAAAPANAGMK